MNADKLKDIVILLGVSMLELRDGGIELPEEMHRAWSKLRKLIEDEEVVDE